MKYILPTLILATFLSASAAEAATDNHTGMFGNSYFAVSGNASWMRNSDTLNTATGETGNVDYNTGWAAQAALGYMLPSWGDFRFELEGGYHQAGLDTTTTSITGTTNPGGTMKIASYMGNIYYDLRSFHLGSKLVPYVGAGAGGAYTWIPRNSGLSNTDRSDNSFAYQFMAGLSYVAASMPNTDWSLGYRYFAVHDPKFGAVEFDTVSSNSIELGARFHF